MVGSGNMGRGPKDRHIGLTVAIVKGPQKGYVGTIKDTNGNVCRVELRTGNKIITIDKEKLRERLYVYFSTLEMSKMLIEFEGQTVHYRFLITDLEDLLEGDHGEEHQLATHMLHKAHVRQDGAWAEHQILMQPKGERQHGTQPREHLIRMQTVERPLLGTHLPGRRTLMLQTVERPQRGMRLREHPIRTHLVQVGGLPHGRTQVQQAGLLPVQRQRITMVGEVPAPCKTVEQAVGALPPALDGEREVILGGNPPYVLIKFSDDFF